MTALELRIIVYALLVLGLMILGGWVGAHFTAQHYEALQAKESQLAAAAAQAVINKQDIADKHNREVQDGLQTTLVSIANSRDDLARRLLNAQATGSHMPKGSDRPLTPSQVDAGRTEEATRLAGALTECFTNEARQDALIDQLLPQL